MTHIWFLFITVWTTFWNQTQATFICVQKIEISYVFQSKLSLMYFIWILSQIVQNMLTHTVASIFTAAGGIMFFLCMQFISQSQYSTALYWIINVSMPFRTENKTRSFQRFSGPVDGQSESAAGWEQENSKQRGFFDNSICWIASSHPAIKK